MEANDKEETNNYDKARGQSCGLNLNWFLMVPGIPDHEAVNFPMENMQNCWGPMWSCYCVLDGCGDVVTVTWVDVSLGHVATWLRRGKNSEGKKVLDKAATRHFFEDLILADFKSRAPSTATDTSWPGSWTPCHQGP